MTNASTFLFSICCQAQQKQPMKKQDLKQIINDNYQIDEISIDRAFELLSHMKGGPSIQVLIDLALSQDGKIQKKQRKYLRLKYFFMKLTPQD